MGSLNDHSVHFTTTAIPLQLPQSLNNRCKIGRKIRHSHEMTCFMTVMTYGWNCRLNYGHRSRTTWSMLETSWHIYSNICSLEIVFFFFVLYWYKTFQTWEWKSRLPFLQWKCLPCKSQLRLTLSLRICPMSNITEQWWANWAPLPKMFCAC